MPVPAFDSVVSGRVAGSGRFVWARDIHCVSTGFRGARVDVWSLSIGVPRFRF